MTYDMARSVRDPLSANPATLEAAVAHLIGDNGAVGVHRSPNVAVPHKLLLNSDASSDGI
jgi:hypothetical protein